MELLLATLTVVARLLFLFTDGKLFSKCPDELSEEDDVSDNGIGDDSFKIDFLLSLIESLVLLHGLLFSDGGGGGGRFSSDSDVMSDDSLNVNLCRSSMAVTNPKLVLGVDGRLSLRLLDESSNLK